MYENICIQFFVVDTYQLMCASLNFPRATKRQFKLRFIDLQAVAPFMLAINKLDDATRTPSVTHRAST